MLSNTLNKINRIVLKLNSKSNYLLIAIYIILYIKLRVSLYIEY